MTSLIKDVYININEGFPDPGVDNDSQGFRDNFDIIKSSLALAADEIGTLQDTAAKTNAANNFGGNTLEDTLLVTNTEKSYAPGVFSSGTPQIQFRNGSQQRIILDANDLNIVISWRPTAGTELEFERFAKMVIEVKALEALDEFDVNWAIEGGGDVKYSNNYPNNFKVTNTPKFLEFSTYDAGANVFVRYLGEYSETLNELNFENYDALSEQIASGTVSLEAKTTRFNPVALATATLTAGVEGQVKVLVLTSTGEITVNVAAPGWKTSGGGSFVLNSIGEGCTMLFTNNKWYCIGNNGAVFS